MNELTAHPIADLLPLMTEAEFAALKDDIEANGLIEPIWLYQGQILDGRNRYQACIELGVQCAVREYTGDTPATFVLSMHNRRDLTKSQKAAVAVAFLPHLEQEAQARMMAGINQHTSPRSLVTQAEKGKAVDHAAKSVGCGSTFVMYAKRVHEEAPELFEQVKRGEVSVKKAYSSLGNPVDQPVSDAKPRRVSRAARAQQIKALADEGYRGEQIAASLQVSVETIRSIAREYSVGLPEFRNGRTKKSARIKTDRVIQETVNSLIGLRGGLEIVKGSIDDIDPKQASEWAEAISEPLKSLNWLQRKLREIANGN